MTFSAGTRAWSQFKRAEGRSFDHMLNQPWFYVLLAYRDSALLMPWQG
jgi:hypothetical protein